MCGFCVKFWWSSGLVCCFAGCFVWVLLWLWWFVLHTVSGCLWAFVVCGFATWVLVCCDFVLGGRLISCGVSVVLFGFGFL